MSKAKVTNPIYLCWDSKNAQYLPNGKAYMNFKLGTHTENEDPYHWQAPWPPRSKVSRSRDVSDRCWPIRRERNVLETPKLTGRFPIPQAITRTSCKVKGQGHLQPPSTLMLRPEMRYIFRTETITDGEQWAVSPSNAITSKIKDQGRKVTWCVWQVLATGQ